jgi:hypothetical protein
MKTIILIIFLIVVGAVFGQEEKIVEKDTLNKKYVLTLKSVKLEDFTPEEQDFLFFHTTPAYCFDAEFRKKAMEKLQSTLKH